MSRSKIHIWTTIALLAIPLVMIWLNGHKAINALFWNNPEVTVVSTKKEREIPNQILKFGIYDPYEIWKDSSTSWDYRQIYINWLNFNRAAIEEKIYRMQGQGSKVILVIEPWGKYESPLFSDIIQGKYDLDIENIKDMLNSFTDTIYISWGHEMDQDLTSRYDWSSYDTNGYKLAYKYVHRKLQSENIEWIWAPVGKENCYNYYPGDKFVDIIGLPIYSLPTFDYEYYGKIRSFKEAFSEKYKLIKDSNKSVFLLEFGVSGSEDYEAYWVKEAFEDFEEFPLLSLVVFFNSRDTEGAWGEKYGTPDWSINQDLISSYIKSYRQN